MEEIIIKKPCAVQKIETSQGFSIFYKEHFLYSKYNPSKNIISAVENLQLLPGTIILCNSPLLCYGLSELLQKLPQNCLIILCEAEKELFDFCQNEKTFDFNDNKIITVLPEKLNDLPFLVYDLAEQGIYKRVIKIDFSAGVQFNKDYYDKLFAACTDSVMTFWKNRITLTKFGRRYSKNLFENLKNLGESKPVTDYFETVEKPIIVFGAGESTQTAIDELLRRFPPRNDKLSDFFILCADTALQPLLKNGIKPDGVFVEEAQSVIVKAFIGVPTDIQIFAGLSSIPNISHKTQSKNISYFFTEYTKASFIEGLKTQSFMPPANKPFGSVGLTAVYYALKFRKNTDVPVYVAGLDFSYSTGSTHTKGALAHILRLISSNRLNSIANYSAAFGPGTEKIYGKKGNSFVTSVTLKNYAAMFRGFFEGTENLFDVGQTGIDLGLPLVSMDCHVANATRNDSSASASKKDAAPRHCEAKGRCNPVKEDIKVFLQDEHKALERLRDLLTGKTELKDDKLLEEIQKIAEPREYLYLHFPDGCRFSTDQSFLNRIRTEIDFFLKYM